jgi:hypothetical protein
MTTAHTPEVVAYWERAEQSLQAARDLAAGGYYDIILDADTHRFSQIYREKSV